MYYRVTTATGQTIDRHHRPDAERAAKLYGGTVQIINEMRILRHTHGANLLTGKTF